MSEGGDLSFPACDVYYNMYTCTYKVPICNGHYYPIQTRKQITWAYPVSENDDSAVK